MICVFGDSIAAGQGVPVGRSWPALLGTHVRAVCGDTTRMALERMPRDVQDYEPEVLLVQFGLNDCNSWETDRGLPRVSLPAFTANLREIIARGRRFGAEVFLLTNHPTRKSSTYEASRTAYNRAIREVAEDHGAVLVDIEREWTDGRYLHDAIHLNPEGHRFYAEQVGAVL